MSFSSNVLPGIKSHGQFHAGDPSLVTPFPIILGWEHLQLLPVSDAVENKAGFFMLSGNSYSTLILRR